MDADKRPIIPVRLRAAGRWLARPRTAMVVGPIGFAVGVAVLTLGLLGVFNGGGSAPAVDAPLGHREGGRPGSTLSGPSQQVVQGIPYLVPPVQPLTGFRLRIDALDVNAPVVELGLDPRKVPQVTDDGVKVAWYNFSAFPGEGGNAVFAGHVSWARTPAVFFDLEDLQAGDEIRLVRSEAPDIVYEVFASFSVDPKERDSVKVMAPVAKDMVTLITCGGRWVPDSKDPMGGSFTERIVVQASRVQPAVNLPAAPDLSDS